LLVPLAHLLDLFNLDALDGRGQLTQLRVLGLVQGQVSHDHGVLMVRDHFFDEMPRHVHWHVLAGARPHRAVAAPFGLTHGAMLARLPMLAHGSMLSHLAMFTHLAMLAHGSMLTHLSVLTHGSVVAHGSVLAHAPLLVRRGLRSC
jgi:hypothetical protein